MSTAPPFPAADRAVPRHASLPQHRRGRSLPLLRMCTQGRSTILSAPPQLHGHDRLLLLLSQPLHHIAAQRCPCTAPSRLVVSYTTAPPVPRTGAPSLSFLAMAVCGRHARLGQSQSVCAPHRSVFHSHSTTAPPVRPQPPKPRAPPRYRARLSRSAAVATLPSPATAQASSTTRPTELRPLRRSFTSVRAVA